MGEPFSAPRARRLSVALRGATSREAAKARSGDGDPRLAEPGPAAPSAASLCRASARWALAPYAPPAGSALARLRLPGCAQARGTRLVNRAAPLLPCREGHHYCPVEESQALRRAPYTRGSLDLFHTLCGETEAQSLNQFLKVTHNESWNLNPRSPT